MYLRTLPSPGSLGYLSTLHGITHEMNVDRTYNWTTPWQSIHGNVKSLRVQGWRFRGFLGMQTTCCITAVISGTSGWQSLVAMLWDTFTFLLTLWRATFKLVVSHWSCVTAVISHPSKGCINLRLAANDCTRGPEVTHKLHTYTHWVLPVSSVLCSPLWSLAFGWVCVSSQTVSWRAAAELQCLYPSLCKWPQIKVSSRLRRLIAERRRMPFRHSFIGHVFCVPSRLAVDWAAVSAVFELRLGDGSQSLFLNMAVCQGGVKASLCFWVTRLRGWCRERMQFKKGK